MSNVDLKVIEDHIKGLIFKKNPDISPPTVSNNSDIKQDQTTSSNDKCLLANVENEVYKDKQVSCAVPVDSSLMKNSRDSQLIDINVLTDFAAKHANVSEQIPSARWILPHPELETKISSNNSLSKETDANTEENKKLSDFDNISRNSSTENSKGNKSKSRNIERNVLISELKNNRKKSKKSKQKIDKESPIQKTFEKNELEVVTAPKQDGKIKEHTSPSKSFPNTPEKKKESLSKIEVSEQPKLKLPVEGMIYSFVRYRGYHRFNCVICDFEARSKDAINKHLNSDAHKEMKIQIEMEKILPFLPKPLPSQAEAITKMLFEYHVKFGLQMEDLTIRNELASRVKKFVEANVPGCTVEMTGSSVTGLGLKDSKVDFIFKVDSEQNIPDSLELLYETFQSDPSFEYVINDFKQKRMNISFCDFQTNLNCNIVLECGISEKLANLLSVYCQLDPRVQILGTVLRYWAKLCGIDNQERGTLPAFSFTLLLVYFLQQIQPPVLPVIHELKEYTSGNYLKDYVKSGKWMSENNDSLGELWIKFFHFYNFTYQIGKHVVCIRHAGKTLCSEKNWTTKFYAIEDPFLRRNIAHVIPSFQMCQYIQKCFFRTYRYFAHPQLKKGKVKVEKNEAFSLFLLSECFASNKSSEEDKSDESVASDIESNPEDFEDHDPDLPIENVISSLKNLNLVENDDVTKANSDVSLLKKNSVKVDSPKKESKNKEKSLKAEEKRDIQNICTWDVSDLQITVHSFNYEMHANTFKGKKGLPYSCRECKSTDHTKKNCPKDELPIPCLLPEMTSDYRKFINKVLHYIKDKNCISDSDRSYMAKIMQDIEEHIRKQFLEASLSMFGSFCNGFGFKNRSDMDFCLTFKGQEDAKNIDCVEVIENLAKNLKQFPKLGKVIPVTSAKVPIVKFTCTVSQLEGDISLYNTLAIANTEMLEAYSQIDPRVQILGFALKYFAKVLGICDASRGSLSSYAYILMVIYFLQQRIPPVCPVLQELHGEEKPQQMIDGWNVWFFKNVDKLPEIWPDCGKNKESAAELWLALLSFYAYDFDWKEYVVSIRQKTPLKRFRKLWITDQIAIEDPFDLNHNLGAGLSRKMNMYILKTFTKGRQRFGTPLSSEDLYCMEGHEVSYLFDRHFLNSGSEPPHDRGCRQCGKIGHLARNCPEEKPCLFCKKTGHLVKDCPKKHKQKGKQKHVDRNSQDSFQYNKNPIVQLKNQSHLGHPLALQGRDMRRNSQDLSKISDERKLVQMGYTIHRPPPPGFAQNFNTPPPGFKQRFPINPNGTIFPRNFQSLHAYPGTLPDISQSPPKHYNSSPPKNYVGNNNYHTLQEPPMNIRSGNMQEKYIRDPRQQVWHNAPQIPPNKCMDHCWKRTN